jgi:hypothetical protein
MRKQKGQVQPGPDRCSFFGSSSRSLRHHNDHCPFGLPFIDVLQDGLTYAVHPSGERVSGECVWHRTPYAIHDLGCVIREVRQGKFLHPEAHARRRPSLWRRTTGAGRLVTRLVGRLAVSCSRCKDAAACNACSLKTSCGASMHRGGWADPKCPCTHRGRAVGG